MLEYSSKKLIIHSSISQFQLLNNKSTLVPYHSVQKVCMSFFYRCGAVLSFIFIIYTQIIALLFTDIVQQELLSITPGCGSPYPPRLGGFCATLHPSMEAYLPLHHPFPLMRKIPLYRCNGEIPSLISYHL